MNRGEPAAVRIFLIGFMGAGKTSTGAALATRLEASFIDLDSRVEAAMGVPVAEIFRRHGEPAFRGEETRQLAACSAHSRVVVATGGGTFASAANRAIIARAGVSVFLDVPWGEVARRLPGKRDERPLFATPEQALELYRRRWPFYARADLTVRPNPDESPEAVAGRILLLLPESCR